MWSCHWIFVFTITQTRDSFLGAVAFVPAASLHKNTMSFAPSSTIINFWSAKRIFTRTQTREFFGFVTFVPLCLLTETSNVSLCSIIISFHPTETSSLWLELRRTVIQNCGICSYNLLAKSNFCFWRCSFIMLNFQTTETIFIRTWTQDFFFWGYCFWSYYLFIETYNFGHDIVLLSWLSFWAAETGFTGTQTQYVLWGALTVK